MPGTTAEFQDKSYTHCRLLPLWDVVLIPPLIFSFLHFAILGTEFCCCCCCVPILLTTSPPRTSAERIHSYGRGIMRPSDFFRNRRRLDWSIFVLNFTTFQCDNHFDTNWIKIHSAVIEILLMSCFVLF